MKSPHQTIVELRFLELGLVPPALDLKKALESMDARKSRRKFRKLHRKFKAQRVEELAKRKTIRGNRSHYNGRRTWSRAQREQRVEVMIELIDCQMGDVGESPDHKQRENRKRWVRTSLGREVFLRDSG